MCELFGITAKRKYRLNSMLEEFYSHSDFHKDGWSITRFEAGEPLFVKEALQASKSEKLKEIMSEPIEASRLLAHIRYATMGRTNYDNCHPFVAHDVSGRSWTFIHNGTFFATDKIAPYARQQKGTTDSERFFLYLMDRIDSALENKGAPLEEDERFRIVDDAIYENSYDNKLNLILYDGDLMYVHRNAGGGMHIWQAENMTVFSTQALAEGDWKELPINIPAAYREGEELFTGRDHGNEFIAENYDWSFVTDCEPA